MTNRPGHIRYGIWDVSRAVLRDRRLPTVLFVNRSRTKCLFRVWVPMYMLYLTVLVSGAIDWEPNL